MAFENGAKVDYDSNSDRFGADGSIYLESHLLGVRHKNESSGQHSTTTTSKIATLLIFWTPASGKSLKRLDPVHPKAALGPTDQ